MFKPTKRAVPLLATSMLIAASYVLSAPNAEANFFNTQETELLGIHTFNPVTKPANEPAAIAQSASPLYPGRYAPNTKTNPHHISPLAVTAKTVKQDLPDIAKLEAPIQLAKLETPAPHTQLQEAEASNNIRLPLAASKNQSPLAVHATTDSALENYQRQRGIIGDDNNVVTASPALEPLPSALPEPAPFNTGSSNIAPPPARAANKDIIEPGISYAPEPTDAPISLGQPINTVRTHTVQPLQLSDDVREVLAGYPNDIDSVKPGKAKKVNINRVSPDIAKIVNPNEVEASYEAAGIKIEVSRSGLDTNYELSRAYDALTSGNTSEAIRTYRDILSTEPNNEEALFGLAATLHRIGAVEKAQPLYASLLKRNPNHREALNNYLSVIGNDAPEDAIIELGHLKARNPSFSPIPAQMGLLFAKLGQYEQARAQTIQAIALAPENLAYQYNLAVILDKQHNYADAAALYGSLLRANQNGAALPVDASDIQKRFTYLSEKSTRQLRAANAQ